MKIWQKIQHSAGHLVCLPSTDQAAEESPRDKFAKISPTKLLVPPREPRYQAYLVPNEVRPQRMVPLTRHAVPGVYVGVGTERCWFALALHPGKFMAAVLADRDPRVVFYNQVNLALLLASSGALSRYMELRSTADSATWERAGQTVSGAKLLQNKGVHRWWFRQIKRYT